MPQFAPGFRAQASAASAKLIKKQIAAHGRSNMVSSVFPFRGGGSRQVIDFRKIRKKIPPMFLLGLMTDLLFKKARVTIINSGSDAYSSLLLSPKAGEAELIVVPAETGGLAMAKLLTATIISLWFLDVDRGLEISVLDSGAVTIKRRADEKSRIYLASRRAQGTPSCRPRHFNPAALRFLAGMAGQRVIADPKHHAAWRGTNLQREAEVTLIVTTKPQDAPAWENYFGTAIDLIVDVSKKTPLSHRLRVDGGAPSKEARQ